MDQVFVNKQSLPAWTYTSEDFFELEKKHLFKKSWQLVCHVSNVPNTGDYFTFDFVGESVFVIRGEDDEIRGFHNVCRHRAARLLDGPEGNTKKRVSCPYHAWCYSLKGALTGVPHRKQFSNFDEDDHSLAPVDTEIFKGFVFIRVAGDGPSLEDMFKPYLDEISAYNMEDLQPMGRVTMRKRDVNWKNIADNYVDSLHIEVAHPGLTPLLDNDYRFEVKGDIHKMCGDLNENRKDTLSNRMYKKYLPDVAHLPEVLKRHWLYYRIWPNVAFDIYPDQIDFMQFIPLSATTTMIREIAFCLPNDNSREMKAARYLNWRINRMVNLEDTDLVSRVQAGMSSSSYTSGPFADNETMLIDSANKIRDAIPIALEEVQPKRSVLLDLLDED